MRGAIVAVDPHGFLSRLVVFQYNPDTVTRTLQPHAGGAASGMQAPDGHRLWSAPTETISMQIELDATDGLEKAEPVAASAGILPQLSALELLLYPSAAWTIANTALMAAGTIEILPPESPLTVLVYGPGRALPVAIQGLTITEQAFDVDLTPVRATVDLTARVLTCSDLPISDPGHALFLVHQVLRETHASIAGVSGALAATALTGA